MNKYQGSGEDFGLPLVCALAIDSTGRLANNLMAGDGQTPISSSGENLSVDGDPVDVSLLVVAAPLAVEHGNIVPLSHTIHQTATSASEKRERRQL